MNLKNEIIQISEKFLKWYEEQRELIINASPKTITNKIDESIYPYIIYNEHDLCSQLSFAIMDQLPQIRRSLFHYEYDLKLDKYKQHPSELRKQWNDCMDKILKAKQMNKPKARKLGDIDLLIETDDYFGAFFDICIEFKYFHYDVKNYDRENTPMNEIDKKYEVLKILKECGITKEILIIVGDLYYHRKDEEMLKKLHDYIESIPDNDILYLEF